MNIIQGKYKGKRIICPPGRIRPSTSRMRKSFFDTLGSLEGESFLDLFSGSGIMAIEALSRGADRAVLVESDKQKHATLHKNCINIGSSFTIYHGRVERFVRQWKEIFSIIYIDPPFVYAHKQKLILQIFASRLVSDSSIIIMHHPTPEADSVGAPFKQQRFGGSTLSYYNPV